MSKLALNMNVTFLTGRERERERDIEDDLVHKIIASLSAKKKKTGEERIYLCHKKNAEQ